MQATPPLPSGAIEDAFQVRVYETGPHGRISARALCDYLQEMADRHATELGCGISHLLDAGCTWMLTRLYLVVDRLPLHKDVTRVRTWPSGLERLAALRDFALYDANGAMIGRASTSWVIVDLERGRPTRPPEIVKRALPESVPERVLEAPATKPEAPEAPDVELKLRARLSDTDVNAHANNTAYVDWAMEGAREELLAGARLRELDIMYRGQCRLGDAIVSQRQRADDGSSMRHAIRDTSGRELALVRSVWDIA